MKKIRIATRKSPLALCQSEQVRQALMALHPQLEVELCRFSTEGDRRLDQSLAKIGGKGLFIKALEAAILAGDADIAVHSVKDMPAELPMPFAMSTVFKRHDVHDVLVSDRYHCLDDLPIAATVGTSSLRRQAQLSCLRPDVQVKLLRGNINTRLEKLNQQQYDAIILAQAGLQRLGLQQQIAQAFSVEQMLPAIGQGALCVEYHQQHLAVIELLKGLQDTATERCIQAERQVARQLQAGCQAPLAAYAVIKADQLCLRALVASVDGQTVLQATQSGAVSAAVQIGDQVVMQLLQQGAAALLKETEQ